MKTYRYSNGRIFRILDKGIFKVNELNQILIFDEASINFDKILTCSKCGCEFMPLIKPLSDSRKCFMCGKRMNAVKIGGFVK